MRSLRFLPLLLLAALLLQACGEGDPIVQSGTDTGGTEPAGTRPSVIGPWILVGLTIDGAPATIPPEVGFEMSIEGGQISGLAGCNQFGGDVDAADDGSFSTGNLFITEMACEPLSLLDFEQVYLGALGRATVWEVTPAGLTLSGDGVELVYELAPPAVDLTLEGTTWTFDSIYQGEGVDRAVSSTRLDKPAVTLTVAEGMATLTSDDCGEVAFALSYEPGGEGNVAVPDPDAIVATCDDPDSNMRAALAGITEATGYMIHETRLTFIGLPGETVGFSGQVG